MKRKIDGKTPRNKREFWMFKAPIELKQELDKVRLERIKKGKDIEMQSYKRLGLAMSRHENLLKDLMNSNFLKEDKKWN